MIKNYAVINKTNKIVENIILADDDFISYYKKENENSICIIYDTDNEDDTKVARIGEIYLDNKFLNGDEAIKLELLTKEQCLELGMELSPEESTLIGGLPPIPVVKI